METIRKFRIAGISIFDVVATLLAARFFRRSAFPHFYPDRAFPIQNQLVYFSLWFLLAIVTHYVTNTPTNLNYFLGLSKNPHQKRQPTELKSKHMIDGVIFDVMVTALVAYFFRQSVFPYFIPDQEILVQHELVYFLSWFLPTIIIHYVTNTPTTLNYYLGLRKNPHVVSTQKTILEGHRDWEGPMDEKKVKRTMPQDLAEKMKKDPFALFDYIVDKVESSSDFRQSLD